VLCFGRMNDLVRFACIVALGLFTAWIARLWIGLFDNVYVAVAIWFPACLLIAFIYDRRQSRLRSNEANSTRD
jgi:uncharacterized membrane protein YedE/YeeE